jgi:CRISPR/Cas system-associated protein Csm6
MAGHAVTRWRPRIVAAQSVYYVVSGLWPVVNLPSFEAVTGPKTDDWLVITVGLLATAIGISLGTAVLRAQAQIETVNVLAIGSALAFATIDLVYGLSGRIRPIYLADAGIQLVLVLVLLLTTRRREQGENY